MTNTNNPMNITVESVTEHDDGSATVIFNMSNEATQIFAKIGLLKVLTDSANEALSEHGIDTNEE